MLKRYRLQELQKLHSLLQRSQVPLKHLRAVARRVGVKNAGGLTTKSILEKIEHKAPKYFDINTCRKLFIEIKLIKKQPFAKVVSVSPKTKPKLKKNIILPSSSDQKTSVQNQAGQEKRQKLIESAWARIKRRCVRFKKCQYPWFWN